MSASNSAEMAPVDVSMHLFLPHSDISDLHWCSRLLSGNDALEILHSCVCIGGMQTSVQSGATWQAGKRERGVESDLDRSLPLEGPESSLGGGVLRASLDPPRAMGASVPSSHCLGLTTRPLLLVSPVVKPAGTASSSSALRFRCIMALYLLYLLYLHSMETMWVIMRILQSSSRDFWLGFPMPLLNVAGSCPAAR